MTEHVSFIVAIKAERLRLASTVARDQLRLETLDQLLRLYEPPTAMPVAADHDDDFERITNPEAPKPLPDVADDFAAAIVRPVEAKTSDQEPLSNGSGEMQDECAIHLPARTREESRERQTAGENPASKPEASLPEPMEPEGTAAVETGKPAGEGDGTRAAPLTKKERVARTHDEHPDWTIAKIAAHLNLTTGAVGGHLSALGIKLGHKGTPRKREEGEPSVPATAPEPPLRAPTAPVFVAPKGELAETTAKRGEVAALNGIEPWLPPHEAAARLQIPLVNLRIFSSELGIIWAQPRPEPEPKPSVPAEKSPTISQRVAALRRMHPTWTPTLIATELGIRASDVRAVLRKAVTK